MFEEGKHTRLVTLTFVKHQSVCFQRYLEAGFGECYHRELLFPPLCLTQPAGCAALPSPWYITFSLWSGELVAPSEFRDPFESSLFIEWPFGRAAPQAEKKTPDPTVKPFALVSTAQMGLPKAPCQKLEKEKSGKDSQGDTTSGNNHAESVRSFRGWLFQVVGNGFWVLQAGNSCVKRNRKI